MTGKWRYTFHSTIGTSHLKVDLPCQDACLCTVLQTNLNESVLIAVATDGAGSALRADFAAQLACNSFVEQSQTLFARGGVRDVTYGFFFDWIQRFREAVAEQAAEEGLTMREFACTALAAIIGEQEAAFFQVGDGAIIVNGEEDDYDWVFWPQKGEFANETNFITDLVTVGAAEVTFVSRRIVEAALFTDGLERLVLNLEQQTVHGPFFRMAFAPLRHADAGHAEVLSQSLDKFLASVEVNKRTDDDKTLILATRYDQQ
jgi:hypothetical protein